MLRTYLCMQNTKAWLFLVHLFRLGFTNPKKKFQTLVFTFTWKIRNRMNRKKNQISDFSDFHFSSYGHFFVISVTSSLQFSMNFHNNLKNKNLKTDWLYSNSEYADPSSTLRNGQINVAYVSEHFKTKKKCIKKREKILKSVGFWIFSKIFIKKCNIFFSSDSNKKLHTF